MRERLTDDQLLAVGAQIRATRDPNDPATEAALDLIDEVRELRVEVEGLQHDLRIEEESHAARIDSHLKTRARSAALREALIRVVSFLHVEHVRKLEGPCWMSCPACAVEKAKAVLNA